jgi:hypothetical protein
LKALEGDAPATWLAATTPTTALSEAVVVGVAAEISRSESIGAATADVAANGSAEI